MKEKDFNNIEMSLATAFFTEGAQLEKSTDRLPQTICMKIDGRCVDFFWGDTLYKESVHLINMEVLFTKSS